MRSTDSMIVSKSPPSKVVLPGPPGKRVSPLKRIGMALELEAHRARRVARGVDRVEPQPSDVDHRLVLDHLVVGRQHGGVLGGDAHRVAGVAELGHRLDVVPVPVRLEHPAHPQALAQLEQALVLVGGVEEHGIAGLRAAEDEDVVVDRAHHHLVDLHPGRVPDQRVRHADERMRRLWRIDSLDRRILAISVPALGSLLVEPIYVLTDTAVVGRLGTAPLGGLALASVVLNTLVWVFNFLSYGTTVRVAVRRGRGDLAGAAADALQALWLAVGIGLVVAAVVGLTADWLVEPARRRPGGDRPGRHLPADQRRRHPVPDGRHRVHRLPVRPARHQAALRRAAVRHHHQPRPRAGARVRARLGDRRQRVGHRHRPGPQRRRVPRHRDPEPARRRAPPPHRRAVGDVAGGQGRRPPGAAHGVPAGRARPWPRRRRRGSAPPSWPATRSPRRCSCCSPSPWTCSRCRASRWWATPSARVGPTRRATSSTTSTAGRGGPGSC